MEDRVPKIDIPIFESPDEKTKNKLKEVEEILKNSKACQNQIEQYDPINTTLIENSAFKKRLVDVTVSKTINVH